MRVFRNSGEAGKKANKGPGIVEHDRVEFTLAGGALTERLASAAAGWRPLPILRCRGGW